MKRGLRIIGLVFMTLVLGLVMTTRAAQARDYTIDKYRVNVQVQPNGDATVEQRITYDFDGAFHGVYYNQDVNGIQGFADPTVSVVKNGQQTQLTQSTSQQANTFLTTKKDDNYKMKVFYPASDETVTFIYRYRLLGVITNYQDTAEMNWKIIGQAWDEPLHNVAIKVQLPAQKIAQLQAWTHGPTSGQTTVSKTRGTVVMKVKQVPANVAVESHVLFPTTVTPTNSRVKQSDRLQAARQQEAKLAKQANQQRLIWRIVLLALFGALLLVGVWHLWIQYRWFSKHQAGHVTEIPLVHRWDIPEVPAATAQSILTRDKPDNKAFSAWLMELAAQDELTITPEAGVFKTYRLTQTAKMTDAHRHDQLIQFIFERIGRLDQETQQPTVTLMEIKQYQARDDDDDDQLLSTHFSDWQDDQFETVETLNYFDQLSPKIKAHAWGLIVTNAILAVGMFVISPFLPGNGLTWLGFALSLALLVVSVVMGGQRLRHLPHYTEAGNQVAMSIKGFRLMLKDMGHFERSQVGDLILWEQILPYAVAFGLAKQVVKGLKANFTDEELAVGLPLVYPLFFYGDFGNQTFATQFHSDFGSVVNSEMSSIDGGSGGFSAGSSGGFGGGSGGGAF